MATIHQTVETIEDLLREPGKAELIGGRIVRQLPTGRMPSRVASMIFISLNEHANRVGRGEAYGDNIGFTVPELRSGRRSFSPDASYYDGPMPANPMRFIEGPPTLAVEVRNEGDRGQAAEVAMAAVREDYFEAGTAAVWDVDIQAETIAVYRSADPKTPTIYRRGESADAEPALPGWRIEVNRIFPT